MRSFLQHILRSLGILSLLHCIAHFFIARILLVANILYLFISYRNAIDVELSKYVGDAYPKGVCAVYCTSGKDIEEPGGDFGLAIVISAARRSPQNFWYVFLLASVSSLLL
jgi:hypothetical protein